MVQDQVDCSGDEPRTRERGKFVTNVGWHRRRPDLLERSDRANCWEIDVNLPGFDLGRIPFRTRWLNEFFYRLSSLMNMREGTYMRWSHTRHHTETIQVGIDPECSTERIVDRDRLLPFRFLIEEDRRRLCRTRCDSFSHWCSGDLA